MNKLYRALLNQMGQKIAIYKELIELLHVEWDSIVDYSLQGTQAILNKKEMLTLKMQVLEENRMKVVAAIAEKLEVAPESLTLKKLLAMQDHPLNLKLGAHRETLLTLIDTINEYHSKTKRLVDHSSLSIKKSLVFLHRTQDRAEAPYVANGRMSEGKTPSRMLSQEI